MTTKLAFVDNTGNVTLVLNTDPSLVASFTQSAHIVDVFDQDVQVGWTYDGANFTDPNPPIEESDVVQEL